MNFLLLLTLVLDIYLRKQFAYLSVFPGIYALELTMLALIASYGLHLSRLKERDLLSTVSAKSLPKYKSIIALFLLLLAVFKIVEAIPDGLTVIELKELPVLIYPFFWVFLILWFSLNDGLYIERSARVFTFSCLLFPPFLMMLYLTGMFDKVAAYEIALWPNNNFIISGCILLLIFNANRINFAIVALSITGSVVCLLIEAQRGAFMCLIIGIILLTRNIRSFFRIFILLVVLSLFVGVFGDKLSYRFVGGLEDFTNFIYSINPDTTDIRYSSTQHRKEMWGHVINNAFSSPSQFFLGQPLSDQLVPEIWRNPHNGYISALGRGGFFAFLFYLLLLLDASASLIRLKRGDAFPLVHIVYFTSVTDAFSQTVFDSPFSLFIVIFSGALSFKLRRHKIYKASQLAKNNER